MPKRASTDSTPAQLLPITMPGPSVPALGKWHRRGLCAGEDPEAFFPSHGDPGTGARRVCAACSVHAECLSYATAADEFGIWGGLDQQERRNLNRRQRRRRHATVPAGSGQSGLTA
jgi:WhiB family redox-sensing transcriptional regulator